MTDSDIETLFCQLVAPSGPGQLPPDTPWATLFDLAERHHLLPLLHQRVHHTTVTLPPDIASRLAAAHRQAAARIMLFECEQQETVSHLQARGIPVIVFKGLPLAKALYDDPSVRPSVDMDLIVHAEHLDDATALLIEQGWEPHHDWEIHRDFAKNVAGATIALELHWAGHRENEFPVSEGQLWQEAKESEVGWLLTPEMTLHELMLHALRHTFTPYRLIVDIAHACVRWRASLDWEHFSRIAEASGAMPLVALLLHVIQRDLCVPLPPHRGLAAATASAQTQQAGRLLSRQRLLAKRRAQAPYRYLIPLVAGTSRPLRLLIGDTIRTPAQVAYIYQVPPGSARAYLYFALRPILLLIKYGRAMLMHYRPLRRRTSTLNGRQD